MSYDEVMLFKHAKKVIGSHREELCVLGVRALSLFGSVARDEAKAKSDIDVLIDFDSKKGLFGFVDVQRYLEQLLGCKVDLVTKKALHPSLKKRILAEAKLVF